jgi:hypothetical protein
MLKNSWKAFCRCYASSGEDHKETNQQEITMRTFQNEFLAFAESTTSKLSELFESSSGESDSLESDQLPKSTSTLQTTLKRFSKFLKKPENRNKALGVLWIITIIILLVVTLGIAFLSKWMLSDYRPGILIADLLWALFFGACILLFLAPKVVTAVFGSFLGTSLSEVGTASGLLTKANESISSLARELQIITNQNNADPFIAQVIWLFVAVVTLLCLPSFFRKEE